MDKMSGRSKAVSDKTKFLNFQPDKCPMSGAISRFAYIDVTDCVLDYLCTIVHDTVTFLFLAKLKRL